MLTSYDGQALTTDAIGNLTNDGTWSYSWQHGRQLAQMSRPDASGDTEMIRFRYDFNGHRIGKDSGVYHISYSGGEIVYAGETTRTSYSYLGDTLTQVRIVEPNSSTSLHFTYDEIGPMSVTYNGAGYFYLKNAQGDVTGLVNSSGTQVVTYTYDAWGNPLTTTGTMAGTLGKLNPFRYRGYVYDTETGLYYLQSRYYNPETGRFINADNESLITTSPESISIDKNQFSYCDNNPIVRTDAEGHNWILVSALINGTVSAVLELASQAKDAKDAGRAFQPDIWNVIIAGAAGAASGALSAAGLGFGATIGLDAALGAVESVVTDIYTNSKKTNGTDYTVGQIVTRATINAGTSALTTFVSGPSDGAAMRKAYKDYKAGKAHLNTKGTTPTKNRIAQQQVKNYKKKARRYARQESVGSPISTGLGNSITRWLQKVFGV